MPWFKVDDKFHDHRKTRAARKAAIGVWTLAGSWCMDHLMDGFVPESVLTRWGDKKDAAKLVEVGLWEPAEQDGEKGWRFCNWHDFQPSKAEIEAEREATRLRVKRWRDGRRNAESNGVTNGVSTVSPSRPDPTRPLTMVTSVSQSSSPPPTETSDGLDIDRIKAVIGSGCTNAHAQTTARMVLSKTNAGVRNRTAYVLAAIRDNPDAYRYRRGNPTKATECAIHPGEWGDACRACAIDQRLGDLA